jgi:predicted RNase H-related nuclease YkuK (DUF458 family)
MRFNLDEVRDFILEQSAETKIYIGCDSERYRVKEEWFADYIVAIVVHFEGKHGCKIFGEVTKERDFDQKKNRPRYRMMMEAYKASEMYLKLADVLNDRNVEVHLDINPSEMHGSNCALNEAIGYIRGTCNVVPMIKPNAWAASCAADRYKSLKLA